MRTRVRVEGTVQGVGFRPYVFGLASSLGLSGFVLNDAAGVLIEVEGDAVEAFLARLPAEAPPLARIERVRAEPVAAVGEAGFAIRESPRGGRPETAIAPDTATCDDCLRELFDPADRRHRYPFVNCTNCGPRFTIVRGIPYDRPLTTMAAFTMCAACRAEYDDPRDRRFHAQPNACPDCGPHVWLVGADAPDAIAAAAHALLGGAIVAVKGIGGFHLACRADDERAVSTLRARKHREDRPFALLVRDVAMAARLIEPDDALRSPARPIVLAPRRPDAPVAAAVAPRSRDLGVMLPYSPLHHLLAADAGVPLVLTSGNVSDEPIAYRDDDALARLAGIADLFLLHDREIHTRTDDSVVRAGRLVRRSRGYVPAPLPLPVDAPPLLACGAELKAAFALARDRRAWVGHHIGDLRNYETLRSFTEGVAHFERLLDLTPAVVAHDLHPEYLSTKYALARDGVETVGVQHHHAHLAACLAEHGVRGPAVGAIFDGTGYGADGTLWGGEILVGDLRGFSRAAHLWPVRMAGGEAAIREPWRMACAWLAEATGAEPPPLPGVDPERWAQVAALVRSGLASPLTSSAGRLCDAVAAMCGIRLTVTYEGQAAIELEAAADRRETAAYPLGPDLDARPTILAVAGDLARGVPVSVVSARFHNALADAAAAACLAAAPGGEAVLSGGVYQNTLLLARATGALEAGGLRVLVPERLPVNDGGIAFGQAAIASAMAVSVPVSVSADH